MVTIQTIYVEVVHVEINGTCYFAIMKLPNQSKKQQKTNKQTLFHDAHLQNMSEGIVDIQKKHMSSPKTYVC